MTGWNKNKLKKSLQFWQAKKKLGDIHADGWITNPYNGRAVQYIKYSRDCNDKITELINSLDLPRKNIKNSFASN